MNNEELDKILKEKLKNQIAPSEEIQKRIREKVEEEKKNFNKQKNHKKHSNTKAIISIAAVAVITVGVAVGTQNIGTIGNLIPNTPFTENVQKTVTIASIEPTKMLNGILAENSEFTIKTIEENLNIEQVQKSIYVEPALEYEITKVNSNEYKLTFKQNIPNNTIVKLQYIKNKISENSWAYQTSNKLSINSTYPDNNADNVEANTIIEVDLSYASVENFNENVSITPEIKGNWEHKGKTWRFKPEQSLEKGQKYVVKINKEITAEGEKLENDYIFNFTVGTNQESSKYTYNTITADRIATNKSGETTKIYYNTWGDNSNKTKIGAVEISKFANVEEFINYVENKQYETAISQGNYNFKQTPNCIELDEKLEEGYYAATIKATNGKEIFNCPIQVNDISAYAIQTQKDVMVWVAQGENLAQNIKVNYLGQEQITNKQGLATFKGTADTSNKIQYIKIGNNQKPLVIGTNKDFIGNDPYSYLYTDRPLYKNTDTINIWGFVPKQFYNEKLEDEFYIQLGNEEKQKVSVDENGVINHKIELKNHMDEYTSISLDYKGNSIAARDIIIENYELQNYKYEIIKDKNYVVNGENYQFNVKVEHISGVKVPNKKVVVKIDEDTYIEKTNENGIATFSVPVKIDDELQSDSDIRGREISVYNGDAQEYTNAENFIDITVICRDTFSEIKENENEYTLTLNKLDTNKNVDISYNLKEIYDGTYDTEIKVNLIEESWERYISYYEIDEYTKENKPVYESIELPTKKENIGTIESKNGIAKFDASNITMKKDTETMRYVYYIEFSYKDTKGEEVANKRYLSQNKESKTEIGYYHQEGIEMNSSYDLYYSPSGDYYTFRYFFETNSIEKFKIGDTVKLKLSESTENGEKEINNEGKVLRIILQKGINKVDIIENNDFDYTFTEKDFPGCKLTSAYFYKGKFYRMPIQYFDYDETERKVDIEITPDKTEYKPKDKVTLTVKTTNNGKPIKTEVNMSIVNEAVFEMEEDRTYLVSQIYQAITYPIYTYSSYRDNLNNHFGGGVGGGDGMPRGDFADTAHFETIQTDSNGIATITFTLPDNVTTYRATAHAANKDLYLGVDTIDIESKLDFFVQSVEPRNVKVTDDLVLNATSVSDEVYNVKYEFTIKELNKTLTKEGTSNSITSVNFGKLPYGTYTAVIKGTHENEEDAIQYKFNIVESAQEVKTKQTITINEQTTIKPTKNPIVLEIYNKNMNQYLKYIDFIESTRTKRLDTQIAYNKIQQIKNKYYNTTNEISYIDLSKYRGEKYVKNLEAASDDIVLTALIRYYTKDYYNIFQVNDIIDDETNLFEAYLLEAAKQEPVLLDLLYLKDEKEIDNYSKLLVTLSLEFLGDYQNAKELFDGIELLEDEKEEYKSLIAIIDTFINKSNSGQAINELINNKPADKYLRFAILSYFENCEEELKEQANVKVITNNINETININGMQVKTYTINSDELNDINFETESKDLMVSYYYQTSLETIESENIQKDINISIQGNLKKENTVTLVLDFEKDLEGEVKISLPNSLRLAENQYDYSKYFLLNNRIDNISFYKDKDCKQMKVNLLVTNEGNYVFENIVSEIDGIYHISNSINIDIK